MGKVTVRYIVNDVDQAISFYTEFLDFSIKMHPAPTFAMLNKGDLLLAISAPSEQSGGGQIMPDGTKPVPGGWNQISLQVSDLEGMVEDLRKKALTFVTILFTVLEVIKFYLKILLVIQLNYFNLMGSQAA